MTRKKRLTEFEPGHGFTQEDWDEAEAAERAWSDNDIAAARPFAEVFPELAAGIRRGPGRPKAEHPKVQTTIRLSADVLDYFKAAGPGWQSRIDEALRKIAGLK